MTNTVHVRQREEFGRTRFEPVCNAAIIYAQHMAQKTLTQRDLDVLKALGVSVTVHCSFESNDEILRKVAK